MNMVPFHHIDKPNYLVIQFKDYKNILMLENYCSDPDCNCNEVLLNFAQLNEENKITNNLLNLKIDLKSGQVLDKTVVDPSVNAGAIIGEFNQHFYQFSDHLNENNEKVKHYFSTYQDITLPDDVTSLITGNNCVDYQKLFGKINQIIIDYNDESYLIEDQYCMKPTCLCNEVILVVYKPNAQRSEFIFRLDITTNKYEILKYNSDDDHNELINYIIENKIPVLKARYERMKELGEKFLS
ncbi:hypothetical protein [Haloplasma contractile]|uniref:Uncharacterized protein n=1 Tax=Haloplasma contractile SSD-17B TaxID=1033810 RepID=U2EEW2_9MOLU|nr:hypothetical protein [Haloplasma contractile]ERJ13231.1 hypothetical protein HLPCO_000855 [Haloplasma contractile SSD-17B]